MSELASQWVERTLSELGEVVTGKTPSTDESSHFGGCIPFITPSDMDGRKTIHTTQRYLTEKGAASVASAIIPPGALMVSCIGSDMGKVARAGKRSVTNQQINSLVIEDETTAEFVYYNLLSRKAELQYMAAGSAQPILNKRDFSRLKLLVPSARLRASIADILGTLDDKIELNRRMNRTLEGIARGIFKSWFVDFDPVHAKAEGLDPNLPKAIVDLFPDLFEDSEIGPIPRGWKVRPLSDVSAIQTKTVKPSKQSGTLWEHYSIPAYDEGQQPKWERGNTVKSAKYAVPRDAVLVSKLNPQFPRIWLPYVYDPTVAICSTEFMPFVPSTATWRPFLYELMRSEPIQDEIKSHATGSTGSRQRVKPKEIVALSVVIPAQNIIDAFCYLVAPLHRKILLNSRQNPHLANLRDVLLPKLLNGDIELDAAKEVV